MPIIKSAKKRVRVAQKATVRNVKTKRSLREAVKAFQAAIAAGDKKKIATTQSEVISAIDTAAKKNVMSANKAARKKSQISAQAKAAGSTGPVAGAPKAAPKPKTAAKKTPAKPTAKKPVAKKSAAKKTTKK